MSIRAKYETVTNAEQGGGGNNNRGIVVVRHMRTRILLIEKRVRPSSIAHGTAQREIRMMQKASKHPHIVELWDYDLAHHHLGYGSLFLQRGELGPLDLLITQYHDRRRLPEDEGFLWKVLVDMATALAWLDTGCDAVTSRRRGRRSQVIHRKSDWTPIHHRDIKPSNIFMTWSNPSQLGDERWPTMLLGDFGCALTHCDRPAADVEPQGDRLFAPPEDPAYSRFTDVFSTALTMACLIGMRQAPPARVQASAGMSSVLNRMLRYDRRDRPTPGELPKYVWRGYEQWMTERRGQPGARLPSWALPRDRRG